MAANTGERDWPLVGFKRIKRGADVPIAVPVPRVVFRKRLGIDLLVARRIPGVSEFPCSRRVDSHTVGRMNRSA
ncbi:DUF6441 family protein [Ralstonia pseudosolanacearum]|uniref:DUF6441 family protein n=1 Tax=Ralstonia pseudosolanacearum TaxID=1310165 RepID=UPI00223408C2